MGGRYAPGMPGPGGCLLKTSPPGTATAAGGTRTTGMHFCLFNYFHTDPHPHIERE